MFLRALAAFLVLPGVAALLAPPLVASVDPWRGGSRPAGSAVIALGLFLLLWCVRDFHVAGRGTLAPWDPPKRLVAVGLYRHVRNPMYLAVLTLVAGHALLFASPLVALYAIALACGFHLRVVLAEEPWLESTFGEGWRRYRSEVPRWLPRVKPRND